ncbi:Fatty acid desaturase, type [Trema orientale]|uniref:Fatty acid desaturase, type n=1 Tax=Trema orientale TaxID=63057 RepID=A0A2P5FWA0_TREOI|nr:Fatty acid desaturase, type [Trema orientale]
MPLQQIGHGRDPILFEHLTNVAERIGVYMTMDYIEIMEHLVKKRNVEKSIDDVHGGDRLPPSVLSVSDSIADHIFQENLEDYSGFLIDEATDALQASSTGESPDGRLATKQNDWTTFIFLRCFGE